MEVVDYKSRKETKEEFVPTQKNSLDYRTILFWFGIFSLVIWIIGIWYDWWFRWVFYSFFLMFTLFRWQGNKR